MAAPERNLWIVNIVETLDSLCFIFCDNLWLGSTGFLYVVHCLSVTLHRPLNKNHTYLRMFFYRNYSSTPISSILVAFWFLRAK